MLNTSASSRRILVTGAASGIGRAAAALFVAQGAKVALLDLTSDTLIQAAAETGGFAAPADLTNEAETRAAIAAAASELGGLDGLINCAGITRNQPFDDTDLAFWNRIISVNLTGTFLACAAARPFLMAGRDAAIVNIASASALLPAGANVAYVASKGGVIAMTKSMAAEFAPAIRVNAICPGMVDTPMTLQTPRTPEQEARIKSVYALQRAGLPEEIAQAILFLSSPASSFVTGISLAIDGGRSYH